LGALWTGGPIIILALMLYGRGDRPGKHRQGHIAAGIFGAERYPVIMGRIAMRA